MDDYITRIRYEVMIELRQTKHSKMCVEFKEYSIAVTISFVSIWNLAVVWSRSIPNSFYFVMKWGDIFRFTRYKMEQ